MDSYSKVPTEPSAPSRASLTKAPSVKIKKSKVVEPTSWWVYLGLVNPPPEPIAQDNSNLSSKGSSKKDNKV
jgi:hypothetical protein